MNGIAGSDYATAGTEDKENVGGMMSKKYST